MNAYNQHEAILSLMGKIDHTFRLNEIYGDVDCSNFINIGVIPNGSSIVGTDDAYIMVNPNAPQIPDMSHFKYMNVCYNTNKDGTGININAIPVMRLRNAEIYPEYRDTYYGELFLGKKKTEEDKKRHIENLQKLNIKDGELILKHDSNRKITNGVIEVGHEPNLYSNNTDFGAYFWASEEKGNDPSNSGNYTYFCKINIDDVYDFDYNEKRYPSIRNAYNNEKCVIDKWLHNDDIFVAVAKSLPISYIKDNINGKIYDSEWNMIK